MNGASFILIKSAPFFPLAAAPGSASMAECHDAADRKIENNKKKKNSHEQTQNGCKDKVTGIPTCP